ncbi:hypothetical protein G9A89_006114 [Geosiphon pyriformis]|nr:hypothetical protein G9A89_006114 [Geosiphon pyriformis]
MGVLPLSLADATSGFNIATNVSSKLNLAGFCCLSNGDVRSALKLLCSNRDVEKHFRIMVRHYNGYCFSPYATAQRVFNINTCLKYLQSLAMNRPINPNNPSNWETSETLLQMLASSPIATDILEKVGGRNSALDFDIWRDPIKHDTLPILRLEGRHEEQRGMAKFYALCRGSYKFLTQRFVMAVLGRYQLRVTDIEEGLRKIATTGDVSQLLGCHERLMSQYDIGFSDFDKNEEHHRLMIEIPSTGNTIIIEFKIIKIDFLNIAGANRLQKGSTLEGYSSADDVLQILFGSWDTIQIGNERRAGNSIIHWITLPGGRRSVGELLEWTACC